MISEYNYRSYCTDIIDIEALALQRYEAGVISPYRLRGASATELSFTLLDYVEYRHQRDNNKYIMEDALWRVTEIDVINRTFELTLIAEAAPKDVYSFTGDMYGFDTMYNDNLYANINGEYIA